MGGRTPGPLHKGSTFHAAPQPAGRSRGAGRESNGSVKSNQVARITVLYDPKTSQGRLLAAGASGSIVLQGDVVVGEGQATPTRKFHASWWERDHVSKQYGAYANTPWSQSPFGFNAFGPYQLHIKELESRGIYIHGTMGPGWNPSTKLNWLLSPASHGCVRMNNADNIRLHDLLPKPAGVEIIITTNPAEAPKN